MTRRRWRAVMVVSALFLLAPIVVERVADHTLEARAQAAAAAGAGPEELAALTASALYLAVVAYLVSFAALVALAVSIVGYWKSGKSAATPPSEEQRPGADEGAV